MGPLSYMTSVADRNVGMRRKTVLCYHSVCRCRRVCALFVLFLDFYSISFTHLNVLNTKGSSLDQVFAYAVHLKPKHVAIKR